MDRRSFCLHACQVASLGTLASALTACGGNGTTSPSDVPQLATVSGTTSGNSVLVTVDATSPLAATGGAALVQSNRGSFLVIRAATDTFNAMTSVCTHEQCTITGFSNQTFQCPCHGSQFNSTGGVVNGPASSPLTRFATSFSNSVLTITT